jgi:hypothetical protein
LLGPIEVGVQVTVTDEIVGGLGVFWVIDVPEPPHPDKKRTRHAGGRTKEARRSRLHLLAMADDLFNREGSLRVGGCRDASGCLPLLSRKPEVMEL